MKIKKTTLNIKNSLDVDMNKSEVNTFEKSPLKVIKSIMFNNN